jgi:hypothetical protein
VSKELSKIAYTQRDQAAFAGFRWILGRGPEWEKTEFGFLVTLTNSKPFGYHYTIPEKGSDARVSLFASSDLRIRAFCHTHPASDETGNFGSDDLDSFRKSLKVVELSGIAYYLMNKYREVRLAVSEQDFLRGKSLDWPK